MRELQIGRHRLSDASRAFLVAEIGNNHGGDVDVASQLILEAHRAGADAVKFQRRTNAALYTAEYLARPYAGPQSFGATYGEHRAALELPDYAWPLLRDFAHSVGLEFFATPFDIPACEFLRTLELPCVKLASAFLTHHELIRAAALSTEGPVLMSVGGGSEDDIYAVTRMFPHDRLCLLHATCAYPTPDEDSYLGAIPELKFRYPDILIGYSNHNPRGPLVPAAAYAMGARIIEVHFTLDRAARGTDHAMSLEPNGLRKLRGYLDRLHKACKPHKPAVLPSEVSALQKMGHSAYAACDLPKGALIDPDVIAWKSPAVEGGIQSKDAGKLWGMRVVEETKKDAPIEFRFEEETDRAVRSGDAGARVGDGDDRREDA